MKKAPTSAISSTVQFALIAGIVLIFGANVDQAQTAPGKRQMVSGASIRERLIDGDADH